MPDAVVIGAGPNGLVAANILASAGWSVVLVEAEETPGGAVKSAEVTAPGFTSDLYSSFYPLGVASPALRDLHLEAHGLTWSHAPAVLAHQTPDGRCALLSRDPAETAASLDEYAGGDGSSWLRLYGRWLEVRDPFIDALFTPFPPIRAALRLGAALRLAGGVRFARFAMTTARRLADEEFRGAGGGLLLAGNALHTDVPPEAAGSGIYGWLLAMLGQEVGFPVPVGGAGRLTDALVSRFAAAGGVLRCNAAVAGVIVRSGRAVGVRLTDGTEIAAKRAVLADVSAPQLYLELLGTDHLPPQLRADLVRFDWDHATVKVDWALRAPIPWEAEPARRAGTVHIADGMDEMTRYAADLAMSRVPENPFLLVGQLTTADPSRSPEGTESAWAYTHVPHEPRASDFGPGLPWNAPAVDSVVQRIEARMEQRAPGFGALVIARHVQGPADLQRGNRSLHGGAVNAGTAALHQQLVFRPVPGLARPETVIGGLYLASASAHPGGGVHGAPGANAAYAAIAHSRPLRRYFAGAAAATHRQVTTGNGRFS
ncbi:MAG: NAD(P)/FAD-dependent oxidoreductase [Mycobacteriales bacterium]